MSNEKIKMKYKAFLPQITTTSRTKLKRKNSKFPRDSRKRSHVVELAQRNGLWEALHSSSELCPYGNFSSHLSKKISMHARRNHALND